MAATKRGRRGDKRETRSLETAVACQLSTRRDKPDGNVTQGREPQHRSDTKHPVQGGDVVPNFTKRHLVLFLTLIDDLLNVSQENAAQPVMVTLLKAAARTPARIRLAASDR